MCYKLPSSYISRHKTDVAGWSPPSSPPARLSPKLFCHNSLSASCFLQRQTAWKCHPALLPSTPPPTPHGDGTSGSRFRPN